MDDGMYELSNHVYSYCLKLFRTLEKIMNMFIVGTHALT